MKIGSACDGKEKEMWEKRGFTYFVLKVGKGGEGMFLFHPFFSISPPSLGRGMLRISSDLVWELSLERVSASTMYLFLLECFEGESDTETRE
ncbi:hypothetical protein CEXT_282511 [Caerostris extrusa]|uniref:Uncharacterized protein n=1 Tax=Caerostris extrusa TaxID=172846 RepID=A0AAV4QTE7_CAEEX|nr:hypothetical protein CEXT_282511 [Caerostris extrusa]